MQSGSIASQAKEIQRRGEDMNFGSVQRWFALAFLAFAALLATAPAAYAGQPCCNIILVNSARRLAVAEDASGRIFELTASPSVLRALKPHQKIYANFSKKQISLDGQRPSGTITRIVQASNIVQGRNTGGAHPERSSYTCEPGYCVCRGGENGPDCTNMKRDPSACSQHGGFWECDSHGRCFCSRPPE